jgi:hypothetical protein
MYAIFHSEECLAPNHKNRRCLHSENISSICGNTLRRIMPFCALLIMSREKGPNLLEIRAVLSSAAVRRKKGKNSIFSAKVTTFSKPVIEIVNAQNRSQTY